MPNSIDVVADVVRKLGGSDILGSDIHTQADLAALVRRRIPLHALGSLSSSGVSESEIGRFVIPSRTRRQRAERHQALSVDESDRAVRLARIQSIAESAFNDEAKANVWLRRPLVELGHESPIEVARTDAGARVVEVIIAKIAWGAAA